MQILSFKTFSCYVGRKCNELYLTLSLTFVSLFSRKIESFVPMFHSLCNMACIAQINI